MVLLTVIMAVMIAVMVGMMVGVDGSNCGKGDGIVDTDGVNDSAADVN